MTSVLSEHRWSPASGMWRKGTVDSSAWPSLRLPHRQGSGSCHTRPGQRAAWEGQRHIGSCSGSIGNKPSYTAKKPLPRMLLLLRNSTQSRLSVETRGSGALSPQNLPRKRKRTVRLWLDSKKGLAADREAGLPMGVKVINNPAKVINNPAGAIHPIAYTGGMCGREPSPGVCLLQTVSGEFQPQSSTVPRAEPKRHSLLPNKSC